MPQIFAQSNTWITKEINYFKTTVFDYLFSVKGITFVSLSFLHLNLDKILAKTYCQQWYE
jgi:hypothetical protein